ncbi:hypothetical protein PMAYCL1PPCAC_05009, partial [Pristionchus mayeri]
QMFCPSTGKYRPLDQSTPSINSEVPSKAKVRRHKCVVCHRLCSETRVFTKDPKRRITWINAIFSSPEGRKSLMELLSGTTQQFCESHFLPSDFFHCEFGTKLKPTAVPFFEMYCSTSENSYRLDQCNSTINSNNPSQRKTITCVVCNESRKWNEMNDFTTISTKRTIWVDAVRSTPEGRRSLMALLNTRKRSYLCANHFSPTDYNHFSKRSVLRATAVPFFQDSESKANEVDEFLSYETDMPNEFKAESIEFKNELFDDFEQNFSKEESIEDENEKGGRSRFRTETPFNDEFHVDEKTIEKEKSERMTTTV